jgi:hypothetical protein
MLLPSKPDHRYLRAAQRQSSGPASVIEPASLTGNMALAPELDGLVNSDEHRDLAGRASRAQIPAPTIAPTLNAACRAVRYFHLLLRRLARSPIPLRRHFLAHQGLLLAVRLSSG